MNPITELKSSSVRYKGWIISTKVINGKLWLRFAHPNDRFPRYGYPVSTNGIEDTIRSVRLIIDLAMKLEEQGASSHLTHVQSVESEGSV